MDSSPAPAVRQAGWSTTAVVLTAAAVTTLDGFDSMLLGLTAPQLIRELGISTAALGPVLAGVFAGLLVGALVGGATADRFGHVRTLVASLVLFGLAGLAMPWAHTANAILVNRAVAGIGLGAAAPIAVGLMVSSGSLRAPTFAVAAVWGGIALGGVLAAVATYLLPPSLGWQWLFIGGGVAVVPVAAAVVTVFRGHVAGRPAEARPGLWVLAGPGLRGRAALTAVMFFFGYVTTSMLVSWVPTVLNHKGASQLLISGAFVGINVGSTAGAAGFGFLAQRLTTRATLPLAWVATGLCLLCMALPAAGVGGLALLATAGGLLATGGQALSVALASRLCAGLEATTVGAMVAVGRVGQITAVSLSGTLLAAGLPEQGIFVIAAVSAVCAAGLAVLLMRRPELALSARQPAT